MTTKTELLDKIYALQAQVNALEEQAEAMKDDAPKPTAWVPKANELYSFIDDDGEVLPTTWCEDMSDMCHLAIGNVYRPDTQDAENAVRRTKAWVALGRLNNGFVPDWRNFSQQKWYPLFDHEHMETTSSATTNYQRPNSAYFASAADLTAALAALGEQAKDLWL